MPKANLVPIGGFGEIDEVLIPHSIQQPGCLRFMASHDVAGIILPDRTCTR